MSTADPTWERGVLTPAQTGLVRLHLQQILDSHAFSGSKRTQDFLRLIVEHALAGEVDSLRERMIGAEMFGRPIDYDTGSDSVVRVKATEVRKRLAQYYLETDEKTEVRIELPSGSYVPRFTFEPADWKIRPHPVVVPLVVPGEHAQSAQGSSPVQDPPSHSAELVPAEQHNLLQLASQRRPRILIAAAFGLIVIASLAYLAFRKWSADFSSRQGIRSIAILPLKNLSGDPTQDYFADGMTEELINDLGQVSTLRVISLTSSMSYKGTKKALPEIARELSVGGVVEGSVQREGNQVRISAQLIDARADRPIWAIPTSAT